MTEHRRKLILFWPYLEWGGAQIYFLAIIREAIADWDVTVILPRASSGQILEFIEQTGAKIEFLDFHTDSHPAPSIARKLQRQLRRISVELASFRFLGRYNLRESVLHIEFPPWQSWILFTALSMRRANVFVTMHNATPRNPAWRAVVWKLRLQFVSRLPGFHIFTSNQDAKDKLRGWVEDGFWNDIRVTYTSVNPPEIEDVRALKLDTAGLRRSQAISEDKFIALCVGQFVDRKGRWIFLEAAQIVAREHPDVQFVWMSPSIPSESDQKRLDSYGLGDSFRFVLSENVGVKRADILSFFRIADVFALPSYVEGLPIALLEAMALGVPSISTNVYAIPEAVKEMETGLLIQAGDATALAGAIIKLKDDAVLRRDLSRRGSEFVLKTFDERVASRKALAEYRECFSDA